MPNLILFITTPNSEHGHHLDCKFTSRCTHIDHLPFAVLNVRAVGWRSSPPFRPRLTIHTPPSPFLRDWQQNSEVRLRGGTHIAFLGENARLGHGVRGRLLIVWLVEEVGRLETTLESGQMGASASDDRYSSQDEAGGSSPLCCIHQLQHMAMLVCTAQAKSSVPCPCHPRLAH